MKLLFSIQKYQYLQEKVLAIDAQSEHPQFELGNLEVKYFPDGERYQRILSEVSGREVIIIGGTPTDSDTLELYDLACAIEKYGAKSLVVVVPYFGYSTMERAVKEGEVVTAKSRARLLSSIPRTGSYNTFILMDLHTDGLPHYLEGDINTVHLYCKEVILEGAQELAGGTDFIFACTDAGRAKWVESLAKDLGINAAFAFKRRISADETAVTSISADVQDRDIVIYDDMIRTGGSLISAARAYKNAGARNIYALTTHGLFSNNALPRIKESGLFKKIISTDTHPNALTLAQDSTNNDSFLVVKSVAKLLYDKLVKK